METNQLKNKQVFISSIIDNLADHFPLKLTDASKKDWIDELMVYSEDRILKTKTLLVRSHKGFLHISDFHEAIKAFPKEQKQEPLIKNPIPMPEEFKEKFMNIQKEWSK